MDSYATRLEIYQELDRSFLIRVNDDELPDLLAFLFKIDIEQAAQYIQDYRACGGLNRSSFRLVVLRDAESPHELKMSGEQIWPPRKNLAVD